MSTPSRSCWPIFEGRRWLSAVFLVAALCTSWTGCRTGGGSDGPAIRFHLEASSMDERTRHVVPVALPVSGTVIRINHFPVIVEEDVREVALARVDLGLCVVFALEPRAARALYRISTEHRGQRLVLLVDGEPLGARVLETVIDTGELFIFLEVDDDELPALVRSMRRARG
ncbi:MAG: hypothetical protein JJU00_14110 [Opitutales bacterium]|nr:hypothetical protein [Opitutales bacterium]